MSILKELLKLKESVPNTIPDSSTVEELINFAQEHLSEEDYEKLDNELQGLHIEDEEDHDEAHGIIVDFLRKHSMISEAKQEKDDKKVEAYGVKGAKSTPWRKIFKNQEAYEKWLDKQDGDVEVQGFRNLEEGKKFSFPSTPKDDYQKGDVVVLKATTIKSHGVKNPEEIARITQKQKNDMFTAEIVVPEVDADDDGIREFHKDDIKGLYTGKPVSEEVQLDEKVFDEDRYTWYAWTSNRPSEMLERRGGSKQIEKGMQFGLRAATSKPGTWRLILKSKGPSIIFSVPEEQAKALAKKALELK